MRIPSLFLGLALTLPLALNAQYEFTNGGDNNGWGNTENWKLGAQDPAPDFPDNGGEAIIPAISGLLSAKLSKEITLSNFTLSPSQSFTLDLDGNFLTVDTLSESGATSIISGGTAIVESLSIDDLRLTDTIFTLTDGGDINGGGIGLLGSTELSISGVLNLNATGGFSGGSSTSVTNKGTIRKLSASGTANISAPFTQTTGELSVFGGSLALQGNTSIESGVIKASGANSTLNFQGDTNLGFPTIEVSSGARVVFSNPLSIVELETSGEGEINIDIGDGSLFKASVLDAEENAPIILTSGLQNKELRIDNEGAFTWAGGILTNFENEGVLTIESTGGGGTDRQVSGRVSSDGTMILGGVVTLNTESFFTNSNGTLRFDGGTVRFAAGGFSTEVPHFESLDGGILRIR